MDPIFHLLPDAPKPIAPYSHAVEAGPFVFVFRPESRRRPAR
jgi:2-iminobutanoate/2-iminopropanoate deaminase